MKSRCGTALILTVFFLLLAMAVMTPAFLVLFDSYDFRLLEEERFRERRLLFSLLNRGRGWIESAVEAGRLPNAEPLSAAGGFASLCCVRLEEEDSWVCVYDLNYDPQTLPRSQWAENPGPSCPFPPRPRAFLVRAMCPRKEGGVIIREEVLEVRSLLLPGGKMIFVLEPRPLFWQEKWF